MPGAKRSKQYRKLLQQYQIAFGFREVFTVSAEYYVTDLQAISSPGR